MCQGDFGTGGRTVWWSEHWYPVARCSTLPNALHRVDKYICSKSSFQKFVVFCYVCIIWFPRLHQNAISKYIPQSLTTNNVSLSFPRESLQQPSCFLVVWYSFNTEYGHLFGYFALLRTLSLLDSSPLTSPVEYSGEDHKEKYIWRKKEDPWKTCE